MPPLAGACITWLLFILPLVAGGLFLSREHLEDSPFFVHLLAVALPSLLVLLTGAIFLNRHFSGDSARPRRPGSRLLALLSGGLSTRYEDIVHELATTSDILEQENRIRDAMLSISQSIPGIENLDDLFTLILDKAMEANDKAEMGSIMMLGEDDLLHFTAVRGYDFAAMRDIRVPFRDSFLYVASGGRISGPMVINNIYQFNRSNFSPEVVESLERAHAREIGSTICAPVMVDGELRGLLSLDNHAPDAFADEDIAILDYFTVQTGIAIKNHELLQKTLYLSRYDGPTNTLNRAWFEELVRERCRSCQDSGRAAFTLVLFDLNNLKLVNDHHGHQAGDRLILAFAEAIRAGLRADEPLARYGGDEFIALLATANRDEAVARIEAMRLAFTRTPVKISDRVSIEGGFSYGLAVWPDDNREYEALIKLADGNMYCYKSALKKSRPQ
ncbi:MAG TPA: sensor domain-containing diguanylate cyclase [Spirochaetota bacterium]|nr:sensor domain-containing diguanylate cyclase [Spirochaetota bacterium]HPN82970.1 sensor domain-containing diguanylate cyclase [Spirochaetota bacterium]